MQSTVHDVPVLDMQASASNELTCGPPALSDVVEHRAKQGAISLVVSLGDERATQVDSQAPESQDQPQAIVLVLLYWEAPTVCNTSQTWKIGTEMFYIIPLLQLHHQPLYW